MFILPFLVAVLGLKSFRSLECVLHIPGYQNFRAGVSLGALLMPYLGVSRNWILRFF